MTTHETKSEMSESEIPKCSHCGGNAAWVDTEGKLRRNPHLQCEATILALADLEWRVEQLESSLFRRGISRVLDIVTELRHRASRPERTAGHR